MWSPMRPRRPPLALALQGGGAHGAFTWGVLDALLEHDAVALTAASGSSAGALNAVLLAQGLMNGGPAGARRALTDFWQAVGDRLPADPVTPGNGNAAPSVAPWFRSMLWWGRVLAASGMGPVGEHPLDGILRDQVDFDALRRLSPLRLFIAATHATSGRLRIFREHELDADTVLASACLPQWHEAVRVQGEPFWDGGFSANPPLLPLLRDGGARDLLLVLLLSAGRQPLASSAREVETRVLELGFVSPFLAELRTLAQLSADAGGLLRPGWARSRWHAVDASPALGALPVETRVAPSRRFLPLLRDLGRARAATWWAEAAAQLGRRSSVDLQSLGA